MPTEIEQLRTLRESARRGNWNGCRDAAEALLARIPDDAMLDIARDEVARRLPSFERHHPHIHWPRVWLNALATGEPFTFDEGAPGVLDEAPGPGGNGFAEAIRQLALANAAERAQRVTHAIAAISRVILAEGSELWGRDHRELWDLWYQDAKGLEEHRCYWILEEIRKDPRVVAVKLASWNRLADKLAAALAIAE
jgi:hypothetical protein